MRDFPLIEKIPKNKAHIFSRALQNCTEVMDSLRDTVTTIFKNGNQKIRLILFNVCVALFLFDLMVLMRRLSLDNWRGVIARGQDLLNGDDIKASLLVYNTVCSH